MKRYETEPNLFLTKKPVRIKTKIKKDNKNVYLYMRFLITNLTDWAPASSIYKLTAWNKKTSSNIQPIATRPTIQLSFMVIVISTWRFTDIVLINTNDYLICYQRTSIKLSRIHVYLVMRDSCMLCKVLFICLMKYFKWASFAVRNTFCCKIFLY